MFGGPEMIWIVLIVFLLFGAKKLPEFARSAGESLKEFKKATKEAMQDDDDTPVADVQRRMEVPADDQTSTSANA